MPDWAIVLVAAFGGGLLGAVLQPVVSYCLERIRSKEEIRKRRERHLRRMLTAHMAYARKLIGAATITYGFAPHAPATESEKLRAMQPESGTPTWLPDRIADGELRELAGEHAQVTQQLFDLLWKPQLNQHEAATLPELFGPIRTLQPRIVRRMDELNWPEVDE